MLRNLTVLLSFMLVLLTGCQGETAGDSATVAEPQATDAGQLAETEAQRAARLQATFPAQQRAPDDPALVTRGQDIYSVNCRSCHGQDLRGGDLGGPNLLRSEIVLADTQGELIGTVVREGRNQPGMTPMPPLPLDDAEVRSVAAYIHSIVATARGQGAPPPGTEVPLNILVGDAEAGQQHFTAMCSACHAADGDLSGIATRIDNPETLQNSWVAGRAMNRPADNNNPRRMVTAAVTLDNGNIITGKLVRRDNFVLSLTTEAGVYRSFTLNRGTPAVTDVVVNDPLASHLELMKQLTDDVMHDITAYLVTLK